MQCAVHVVFPLFRNQNHPDAWGLNIFPIRDIHKNIVPFGGLGAADGWFLVVDAKRKEGSGVPIEFRRGRTFGPLKNPVRVDINVKHVTRIVFNVSNFLDTGQVVESFPLNSTETPATQESATRGPIGRRAQDGEDKQEIAEKRHKRNSSKFYFSLVVMWKAFSLLVLETAAQ